MFTTITAEAKENATLFTLCENEIAGMSVQVAQERHGSYIVLVPEAKEMYQTEAANAQEAARNYINHVWGNVILWAEDENGEIYETEETAAAGSLFEMVEYNGLWEVVG